MAYLDEDTFTTVIRSTPLISIDLIIEDESGCVLLGKRTNRPAQGFWFVPGGRILKDEPIKTAFERLTINEVGKKLLLDEAEFQGPFQHFYDDYVFGENTSTHYVVLAYAVQVKRDELILPKEQHSEYAWFSKPELLSSAKVHIHSKWYFAKNTQ